ncbi:hypothetical protein E3T28_14795 [Cryobacterium sinapicolor]|uniref:HNH endonuclease n=1 Tax=Cryobacterium sinapicolor TaxID=1259236 RepID=A0ABY2ITL8_9MICO|nr:hypothetical protein [Cryobacterium sinapicolor]TFC94567.1 hypothetical protein E3T28_14795 [Cryobacterium sinapicolor]
MDAEVSTTKARRVYPPLGPAERLVANARQNEVRQAASRAKPCATCGQPRGERTGPSTRVCQSCADAATAALARTAERKHAAYIKRRDQAANEAPDDGVYLMGPVVWDWSGLSGVVRCTLPTCRTFAELYSTRQDTRRAAQRHITTEHIETRLGYCTVDGCDQPAITLSMCARHDQQARKAAA